ncbi:hypothetical protein [Bdellovibrio bacteriovorus]|uniref:hypothetical protein n=1 Tax=Bdellovibrio bacteriovorus TaxID=959 RepID=UPI0035A57325
MGNVFYSVILLAISLFTFPEDAYARCRAQCAEGFKCVYNSRGHEMCEPERRDECTRQLGECYPGYSARLNSAGSCECLPNSNNNNNNNNNNTAIDCRTQFNNLLQSCQTQIQETSYTCDEKNDSGMNGVADTASQVSLLFGQQTAASIQAACSRMAGLTQAAQGAVAAYRLLCSSSIGQCRSTCAAAADFIRANPNCSPVSAENVQMLSSAESQAKRCDDFQSKVAEAQQAIQNYGATAANAAQCEEQTSGDATPPPDVCKQNPQIAGCTPTGPIDCSKPEMATNKICVCTKTPTDPMCITQAKPDTSVGVGGSIDSSSRKLAASTGDSGLGDIPGLPGLEHGKLPSGGSGEAVDGKQGAGANLGSDGGGSGGGPSGRGGGGAAGEDDSQAVTAGFYGGGSGAGGAFGGGSGRYGAGAAGNYAGAAGANGQGNGPDLRRFLPGGQFDPKRGLSGMGGPDGITGPHTNIWQKIQNRYRVMSPSLLP